ncbi:hypothetical protein EVAR_74487_1 [Eumeta japonica]|uniref:PiggyBac transposable element-derived protein domain-containing protein n=1 Tax=Eumeta variegata TaxID=151549 RepID=A0A4C1TBF3_EUMVA|nr:hypothetical protein EVAR_74487_1 [Eumeta japonica]
MSRSLLNEEILSLLQNICENESDCGSESEERGSEDDNVPFFSSSSSTDESDLEDQIPLATLRTVDRLSSRGRGRSRARGQGRGRGRGRSNCSKDSELQGLITSIDGTSWTPQMESTQSGRRARHNIITEQAGPTSYAKRNFKGHLSDSWRLLIDESILRHIQKCTIEEANRQLGHNNWILTLEQLESFIAISYARGAYGAKNIQVNELWSKTWGINFFSKVMPRDRFKEIMKFLRFDHRSERSSRLQQNKFALIDVWKKFIENCLSCYKPGENVTVDEQLFSTKEKMKAGHKTKASVNPLLCVSWNLFANTGRNVTTDNFFTSLSLANNLLAKLTTIVGTLNRARREVPPYVKSLHMTLFETKILKSDRCTLTIYQGKRNKNVLLLSTLHENVEIDSNHPKKKPETVTFYNATKYGVDVADQMAKKYSVKAASRRWPVQIMSGAAAQRDELLSVQVRDWSWLCEFDLWAATRRVRGWPLRPATATARYLRVSCSKVGGGELRGREQRQSKRYKHESVYQAHVALLHRQGAPRGGTAIYYKRALYCCPIDIPPLVNIEAVACRLSMTGHGILILVNGKEMEALAESLHFDIVTPLTLTYYPNNINYRPDILDIAFMKGVALKLGCIEPLQWCRPRLRKLTFSILNNIPNDIVSRDDIDNTIGALTNHITTMVESSYRTVPVKSDRRERPRHVIELIRDKNAALRRTGKYPTCENRSRARTLQRKVKARHKGN